MIERKNENVWNIISLRASCAVMWHKDLSHATEINGRVQKTVTDSSLVCRAPRKIRQIDLPVNERVFNLMLFLAHLLLLMKLTRCGNLKFFWAQNCSFTSFFMGWCVESCCLKSYSRPVVDLSVQFVETN